MKNRPNWLNPNRPYPKTGGRVENLVSGFKGPKCQGVSKITGKPCGQPAVKWSTRCKAHGGCIKRLDRAKQNIQRGDAYIIKTDRRIAMDYQQRLFYCDGINT